MQTTLDPQTSARIDALEHRLRRAERSLRRGRIAVVLVTLVAVLLGMGQGAGRVTEAGGVIVRDASGTVRAQLGVDEGAATLALFDAAGHLRVGLGAEPEGPILNLFSGDGQPRIVVGERGENAFVILRDAEGAPRAAMAIQAGGQPSMYLLDETLQPLWKKP